MSEGIVRYAEYSVTDFDRDVDRANQLGGSTLMELKQGENVVRFVPSKEPGVSPIRSTGMHYVDAVPGLDKMVVVACPKKELQQPCPICDAATQLLRSPNPIDRERGERIQAKLTLYANVVDRAAPPDDPNFGLRVLRFGKQILEQLKTIRRSERTGGDFFDPTEKGFDIVIIREGTEKSTKYKVVPDRQNSALYDDVELCQATIDNGYDLNTYVNTVVPDALIAALESASGMGRQAAPAARQLPARAAAPVTQTRLSQPQRQAAAGGARAGSSLFDQPAGPVPSGGQTIADADFTDEEDDFGPPAKG
jgi:hypothetical protein